MPELFSEQTLLSAMDTFNSPVRTVAQTLAKGADSFFSVLLSSASNPENFGPAMVMALLERADDAPKILSMILRGGVQP